MGNFNCINCCDTGCEFCFKQRISELETKNKELEKKIESLKVKYSAMKELMEAQR